MPPSSGEAGPVQENLPGITDPEIFREFERGAAAVRIAELEVNPELVSGDFDFDLLQRIHHYILRDVYHWAGRQRTSDTRAMPVRDRSRWHIDANSRPTGQSHLG